MEGIKKGDDKEYVVKFSFTTFDTRRSMMTGRNGQINIVAHVPIEKVDNADIKQMCVNEMLQLKPKWNILALDITDISPFVPKKRKKTING